MDGGIVTTAVGSGEEIQIYSKTDPGAKEISQYQASAEEQANVNIQGLATDKFKEFMKAQPQGTFTVKGKDIKKPRFLLGDITKPLPEKITVLVPTEQYLMTNVFNPKERIKKRNLKLGPPITANYKTKTNVKLSKQLVPEISNMELTNNSEISRIQQFFKELAHEGDVLKDIITFEENYLGWITTSEKYKEEKQKRIVRSAMKLLFQFMFSHASMNDANAYYQHISAGYTKLGYTEKIPCNTDIREDFLQCLQYRKQILDKEIKDFTIQLGRTEHNLALGQLKDFQEKLTIFIEDIEDYKEDFCLVYGDVTPMKVLVSESAVKQGLTKGVTDAQAELLLRLFRNFVQTTESEREKTYSYGNMMDMMTNMSKIPYVKNGKSSLEVHQELIQHMKDMISSNAQGYMDEMERLIVLLQELLKFTVQTINARGGLSGEEQKGVSVGMGTVTTTPSSEKLQEIISAVEQQLPQELSQAFVLLLKGEGDVSTLVQNIQKQVQPIEQVVKGVEQEGIDVSTLKQELDTLRSILNIVKEKIGVKTDAEIPGKLDELNAKIAQFGKEKVAIEIALETISAQLKEKEEELAKKPVDSVNSEALQAEITKLRAQVTKLEGEKAEIDAQQAKCEVEKASLTTQITIKDTEITSLQAQAKKHRTELSVLTVRIATLEGDVKAAEAEKKAAEEAAATATAELEAATKAATEKVTEAPTSMISKADADAALAAEKAKGEAAIAAEEAKKIAAEEQLAVAKAALENAQKELAAAVAAKTAKEAELEGMKRTLQNKEEEYKGKLEEAEYSIETQVDKIIALERQLREKPTIPPDYFDLKEKASLVSQLEEEIKKSKGATLSMATAFEEKAKAQSEIKDKEEKLAAALLSKEQALREKNATSAERNAAKAEIEELKAQIATITQAQTNALTKSVESAEGKKQLEQQLALKEKEIADAQAAARTELEAARKEAVNAVTKKQKEEANARVAEKENKIKELEKILKQITANVTESQRRFTETTTSHTAAIQKKEQEVTALQAQLQQALAEKAIAQRSDEEVKSLRSTIRRLEGDLAKKPAGINSAEYQLVKTQLEKEKSNLAALQASIAPLQEKAGKTNAAYVRIAENTAKIASLEGQIEELQKQLAGQLLPGSMGDAETAGVPPPQMEKPPSAQKRRGSLSSMEGLAAAAAAAKTKAEEDAAVKPEPKEAWGVGSEVKRKGLVLGPGYKPQGKGITSAAQPKPPFTLPSLDNPEMVVAFVDALYAGTKKLSDYNNLNPESQDAVKEEVDRRFNILKTTLVEDIFKNLQNVFYKTDKSKLEGFFQKLYYPLDKFYHDYKYTKKNGSEQNISAHGIYNVKDVDELFNRILILIRNYGIIENKATQIAYRITNSIVNNKPYEPVDNMNTSKWEPDTSWSLPIKSMYSGVAAKGVTPPYRIQKAGGSPLPKQDFCESLLALLLQRVDEIAESEDPEFDVQTFVDNAGATLDDLGQCPLVLDLLMRLLEETPKYISPLRRLKQGLTFHKTNLSDDTQMQLEQLEKSFHSRFPRSHQDVLAQLYPPLTLYSRTPEAYQELLGTKPYILEEHDMEFEEEDMPLHGLEDNIILTEDEQKEIVNTGHGGVSLGALMFLYTVCLKDVLDREEHPTLNSKCPLLTPQRTVERARTPKVQRKRTPRAPMKNKKSTKKVKS